MPQLGPLFDLSRSPAHRVLDSIGPLLTPAPVRKPRGDSVAIVAPLLGRPVDARRAGDRGGHDHVTLRPGHQVEALLVASSLATSACV